MSSEYKKIISILGHDIPLGTSKEINFNIAKLHTSTKIEVPIIIERSKNLVLPFYLLQDCMVMR